MPNVDDDKVLVARLAEKENHILYEVEKMAESLRHGVTPIQLGLGVVRYWITYVAALNRPGMLLLLQLLREAESVLLSGKRMPSRRLTKWSESIRPLMQEAVDAARRMRE